MKWSRHRFHSRFDANEGDYRPIKVPLPGPWWCSGESDDYAILIAWLPADSPLTDWWPEATAIETKEDAGAPVFTDRFPPPDWWDAQQQAALDPSLQTEGQIAGPENGENDA